MNIFPNRIRRLLLFGLLAPAVLLINAKAFALGGDRTLTQYVHNVWGNDEGFAGGTVFAIAQSQDGFIWLGTEHGLIRFDGITFTQIEAPLPDQSPIGAVRGLVEDAAGNLWIRLDGPRLLRYRDGVFHTTRAERGFEEAVFTAMSRTTHGDLLLWGPRSRTVQIHDGHPARPVPEDHIPGIVISTLQTSDGTLWFGTRDVGLFKAVGDEGSQVLSAPGFQSINALAPSANGGVWIGSDTGLFLWERGALIPVDIPEKLRKTQVFALTLDRDRNLWVGTEAGLYRVDSLRAKLTGYLESTKGSEITAIFEDTDGDIWFAGAHGVERLRDGMFTTVNVADVSAAKENGGPIFVDETGRLWFAPSSGGLFSYQNGVATRFSLTELDHDVIYSISGDRRGSLWLGRQQGGLTQLTRDGSSWHVRTYTRKEGLPQNSVYTVTVAHDGAVWAGTVSGGVSVLRDGRFTTYKGAQGLPSNAVFSSMEAADHKMWFASPSGLVCFDGHRWRTFTASATEPAGNVRTVFEDSAHELWIGTSHGLAQLVNGHIQILPGLPPLLTEEVLGIGEDKQGFLWVLATQHVLQVDWRAIKSGSRNEHDVISYGLDDGLVETEGVRRDRSLASDGNGHIWLSLQRSLAFADLDAAEGYRRPVQARIDSISPGFLARPGRPLQFPSETRSVTFQYSGTNIPMSTRTQFRYLLENSDQTWSNGATLRQVVYTNLSPGSYKFRIMASNGLGMWNGPISEVAFDIQPALWQTWYFRCLCALLLALAIAAMYRLRMMQLTEQMNRRFRDRLAERTRIAQDLHDTLLQGVISASMQLDVAEGRTPVDSPTRPMLRRVLNLMRQVTEEGRAALKGLRRAEGVVSPEEAFAPLIDEPLRDPGTRFKLSSEGQRRPLQGFVLDEVYRIGREACINSFAHASATEIEVSILYTNRRFRLTIRDNGCGIDSRILKSGREGHWGLVGMRERAQAIQASFRIRSSTPGGTEVDLSVPGAVAYCHKRSSLRWPWKRSREEVREL